MNTKELFQAYDLADDAVEQAQAALEAALKVRSDKVKDILDTTGSKGPFAYKGDVLKVVVRGDTHFFRGKKRQETLITVVEE